MIALCVLTRYRGQVDRSPRPLPSIHGREFSGAKAAGIDLKELWFFVQTPANSPHAAALWPTDREFGGVGSGPDRILDCEGTARAPKSKVIGSDSVELNLKGKLDSVLLRH